ncbi:MAG: hypothetical protein AABW64_03230 [Nanoarchaeota archaeon]
MAEQKKWDKEKNKKEEKKSEPFEKPVGGKFGGKAQYTIVMDMPQAGVEANYFAILGILEGRSPFGLSYRSGADGKGEIIKIKDIYTAGETSAYFGMVEQRKGAQQDKFQQLMANIGQMIKTLFQMIRELRIIDERLEYYEKSMAGDRAAEVALKGIWVDLVEGGSKNPGSVIGLAKEVGFVTLPDLFFSIHPKNADAVEKEVNKLESSGFNRKIREVLMRKLKQYLIWREKTYKELTVGKEFKRLYMVQHYHVMKIYLHWLRPYLKNIKRLQTQPTESNKDIMAAFDTSKIELEIIAVKNVYETEVNPDTKEDRKFQKIFPCIRVKMDFVAMPQLSFQQEGYQRGAIHLGKTRITIEGFTAIRDKEKGKDEIEEYKQKVEREDFELLEAVDKSILALKDDLEYYMKEDKLREKETQKEEKPEGILGPFKSLIDSFREIMGITKRERKDKQIPGEAGAAENAAKAESYLLYKIFKKQQRMFTE